MRHAIVSRSALCLLASLGLTAGAALADTGGEGAGVFEPVGVLELRLGGSEHHWVHVADGEDVADQAVAASGGCTLADPIGPLMELSAAGPANAAPGLFRDSIGVKGNGAQGVPCSRVSGSEKLTLTLGAALEDQGLQFGDTRLDVEVKKNARILARATLDGRPAGCFELRTGKAKTKGALPLASCGDEFPVPVPITCKALSDSGPDSGDRDNCQWELLGAYYDRLELSALVGEFSLEGGGDGGTTNYSTFELVESEGALACDAEGNSGVPHDELGTLSTPRRGGACQVPILYVLQHRLGTEEALAPFSFSTCVGDCEEPPPSVRYVDFFTSSNDGAQHYNVEILWAPEPEGEGVPPTFWYPGGDETELLECPETRDEDPETGFILVDHNNGAPYACWLEQEVSPVPEIESFQVQVEESEGSGQIQVWQLIYVEGDPTFGRK